MVVGTFEFHLRSRRDTIRTYSLMAALERRATVFGASELKSTRPLQVPCKRASCLCNSCTMHAFLVSPSKLKAKDNLCKHMYYANQIEQHICRKAYYIHLALSDKSVFDEITHIPFCPLISHFQCFFWGRVDAVVRVKHQYDVPSFEVSFSSALYH